MVMCKWLNISAKEFDYSVDDTNDGDSDSDSDSDLEGLRQTTCNFVYKLANGKENPDFGMATKGMKLRLILLVYKLNEEEHRWAEGTNLGEKVLLVGTDCSYSVSVVDFDGCKGKNYVFFLDECCSLYDENFHDQYDELKAYGQWETGVFSLEDESVGPLVF